MSTPSSDRRPSAIIWIAATAVLGFIGWAYVAELEEVTMGSGKVVPSLRGQVLQSLEGGILEEIFVTEGDVVEPGQQLATLDDTRFVATYGESEVKITALRAAAARLDAQLRDRELEFPESVRHATDVLEREAALFESQRSAYRENLDSLEKTLALTTRELEMTAPLVKRGAASEVEVIRLQQQELELSRKLQELKSQYVITAKEQFTKTMAELESLERANEGRHDQIQRTIVKAPVKGIVKNLAITTVGGVVAPGGDIMEIVPIEDQLLIEVRINPRDIAFVRPGLDAAVKLTAYDYSIYGALAGKVERIAPDTTVDENDRRLVYYRVYVKTERASLTTRDGREHPIIPGMVATVEIRTGAKTVLDYLLKPVNKMGEALRER